MMEFESIANFFNTGIITGVIILLLTIFIVKNIYKRYNYKKILKKKINDVIDKKTKIFQKLEGLKTPFTNIEKYCHLNGKEISEKILSGEVETVDILEAYQANALIKDNQLNFISDVIYDADVSALLINRNKNQNLMGWPLSVSDTFSIEKCDCTQGLPSKILQPCSKNSVIITALKNEGAIPFIITNVCHGLQKMETSNSILGKTVHPLNHKMTCGGSSGGEGASLGSKSSLIGIAIDVCGGIRIPAAYCGIYGFKPTSSRVSLRHTDKFYFCDLLNNLSIGPMARYFDDLIVTFKAMTSERVFKLDPYVPPVLFDEKLLLSQSKMKIGFYTHIGGSHINTIPAVERAVMMAKDALLASGHEVVEFNFPNIDYIYDVISKTFVLDEGEILSDGLKNNHIKQFFKLPKCVKCALSFFFSIFNECFTRYILTASGSKIFEALKLKDSIMQYREEVLSMLEKENIDGIICPVLPIVAPPLNSCNNIADIDIYCSIFNILDYPCGSVPVTVVNQDDIDKLNNVYLKKINTDKKYIKLQKETLGLPIGVQCASMPWKDETCLRIMKEIYMNL